LSSSGDTGWNAVALAGSGLASRLSRRESEQATLTNNRRRDKAASE
jgi:hypothetical protein